MQPWQFIYDQLKSEKEVMLLWVLESEGSSPGRKGFKMAVAKNGNMHGTIGGGIMEHKLVEKAKDMLANNENTISLMRQYHDKQHAKDRSGMICSGSQLIAFIPLSKKSLPAIDNILNANDKHKTLVQLSRTGITIKNGGQEEFLYKNEQDWSYSEKLDQRPIIHIIGGGHVGLALSELMSFLGFYIKLYDDRKDLNTMEKNRFANEKHFVDYQTIGELIPSNENEYVVIVTFGYRDDKTVFKQLLDKKFFYLGMMGSDSKIKTLLKELEEEGVDPKKWEDHFLPIGINIYSKTTKEIAVSIAAQIILQKNKDLPTGRTQNAY